MSKITDIVARLAESAVLEQGLTLYDVDYKKEGADWFLRIYVYSPDGVDIAKCEAVSRAVSDVLDRDDIINQAYYLEVSSPGIERALTRDWHFQTAIGETVEVRLYRAFNSRKSIVGVLRRCENDGIEVDTGDESVFIEKGNITRAKIVFNF